jgi:hypothetical protein
LYLLAILLQFFEVGLDIFWLSSGYVFWWMLCLLRRPATSSGYVFWLCLHEASTLLAGTIRRQVTITSGCCSRAVPSDVQVGWWSTMLVQNIHYKSVISISVAHGLRNLAHVLLVVLY